MKQKIATLLLIVIITASAFLALYEVPIVKADSITDAINLGLDWIDRMAYKEIGEAGTGILDGINRVNNPGFESSLSGTWEVEYPSNVYRSTQRAYSGSYSLKMFPLQDGSDYLWAVQYYTRNFSKIECSYKVYVDTSEPGATFGSQSGSLSKNNAIGVALVFYNPSPLEELQFGFESIHGYYYAYIGHWRSGEFPLVSEYPTTYSSIVNAWQTLKITIYPNDTSLFPTFWNVELRWNNNLVATMCDRFDGFIGNTQNHVELFNDAFATGAIPPYVYSNATTYFDDINTNFDSTTMLAVALESPSLSFRVKRSDGYWTIFGKETNTDNLPPSVTMIKGGCTNPAGTTDDLNLITGEIDNQRMYYLWDFDEDGHYDDMKLYVEYAALDNDDSKIAGKVISLDTGGLTLSLWIETDKVIDGISVNSQFSRTKQWGWAGRRYTIRPTTKGLADLYCWLGMQPYPWLDGHTYQEVRGVDYLSRSLSLYRTWYGSGYILDRFDGEYGATLTVRPWAGQYGIPNYSPNPDLILEPWWKFSDQTTWDTTYYVGSPSSYWYSYSNAPDMNGWFEENVLRSATVSRHDMPDGEEWNNCPFQSSDTQFIYAYKSRTGFQRARNAYIANGFEYDLYNYQHVPFVDPLGPIGDVCLGLGTDAKSIRGLADLYKYGTGIPYGLSTLKAEFIDSAQWDGHGIARDAWHGTAIGWEYPAYGTHNTATYGNLLTKYYALTSDSSVATRMDQVIGVLLLLQNKLGVVAYSRSKATSYYRPEFVGSFMPGYAVAYSFGQQDIYSAPWTDLIYAILDFTEQFKEDPQSTSYPCLGNVECTIPAIWTLINYKCTNRTPISPQQPLYTLSHLDNAIAYTDHGGSWGGDGEAKVVSQIDAITYVGGGTGNVYKHVGRLDKIKMNAYDGGIGGEGWSTIEYEWSFTLTKPEKDWRAKMYFTIPDVWGIVGIGGNSLSCKVSLYGYGGYLIKNETRFPLENQDGPSQFGKMFVYSNMSYVSSLSSGTYTVKLQFKCHAGGSANSLRVGYTDWQVEHDDGLPMGIEYFGFDVGWYDTFDDNSRDTTKWDTIAWNGGSSSEADNTLKVTVPSGQGQSGAGYVTKNPCALYNYSTTVEIAEFNSLDEMILEIATAKVTNNDPYYLTNWYRIVKARYYSYIYVQKNINDGMTTMVAATWFGATGTLSIRTSINDTGGYIGFYEKDVARWIEEFALPTYSCYIYVFTSSLRERAYGTDKFDNFGVAPTFQPVIFTGNPYENFYTYEENDPNGHISIRSKLYVDDYVTRNEDAWLIKDYGEDYFDSSFEHYLDARIAGGDTQGWVAVWLIANGIDNVNWLQYYGENFLLVYYTKTGTNTVKIVLQEQYGGYTYTSSWNYGAVGAWYYLKVKKTGGYSLTCKIYSDPGRVNLLSTLSLSLHTDDWFRYIYATDTLNTGTSYQTDADVANLRFIS